MFKCERVLNPSDEEIATFLSAGWTLHSWNMILNHDKRLHGGTYNYVFLFILDKR